MFCPMAEAEFRQWSSQAVSRIRRDRYGHHPGCRGCRAAWEVQSWPLRRRGRCGWRLDHRSGRRRFDDRRCRRRLDDRWRHRSLADDRRRWRGLDRCRHLDGRCHGSRLRDGRLRPREYRLPSSGFVVRFRDGRRCGWRNTLGGNRIRQRRVVRLLRAEQRPPRLLVGRLHDIRGRPTRSIGVSETTCFSVPGLSVPTCVSVLASSAGGACPGLLSVEFGGASRHVNPLGQFAWIALTVSMGSGLPQAAS